MADDIKPRAFLLQRDIDETGVSGTGIVAEGVCFSDGTVALRWTSAWPTSVVFHERGMESVERVHGHGGKTRVVWLEERLVARIIEVMDDLRVRRELAASVAEFAEREEFDPFDVVDDLLHGVDVPDDQMARINAHLARLLADDDVLRDAKAEIDPMRAALDAVDYLHLPRLDGTCLACNHDWPCPTQRLIREARRG